MKRLIYIILSAGVVIWSASTAMAYKPAVLFDMGGKFDKSFNEGIWNGLEKFKKETGIKYREFEVRQEAQREQFLRKLASRGSDPVIAVGFGQAAALTKVAKEFPKTRFSIIDMVVDLPNVQSIIFKEHEGSFLVGVLAAMKSKSGKVGFVGGMDIPLIHKFACGYVQGVKHINSGTTVFQKMTVDRASKKALNLGLRYLYEDRWGGQMNWTSANRGGDEIYGESIYTSRWEVFGNYELPGSEKLNFQFSAKQ